MPATVRYKQDFLSQNRPVETSASVGSDGLITGSAVFLFAANTTYNFPIGATISPAIFTGLQDVKIQGLFVESRNLEKRNGLTLLRLAVVGAINPPIIERKREVSPRGFSRSESGLVFSFDYQAESHTASTVITTGQVFALQVPTPREVNVWNISGQGFISTAGDSGIYDSPPITVVTIATGTQQFAGGIAARPRVLVSDSSEQRAGITRLTRTAQFIYE